MLFFKPKILIIDDDDSISIIIKQILVKEFNVEIIMCNNGLEGIKLAINHRPKLIILDWIMPDYSGLDTLNDLQKDEILKRIPVLMLTGKNLVGEIEEAFIEGATDYLTKPLIKDKLIKKVNRLIK